MRRLALFICVFRSKIRNLTKLELYKCLYRVCILAIHNFHLRGQTKAAYTIYICVINHHFLTSYISIYILSNKTKILVYNVRTYIYIKRKCQNFIYLHLSCKVNEYIQYLYSFGCILRGIIIRLTKMKNTYKILCHPINSIKKNYNSRS